MTNVNDIMLDFDAIDKLSATGKYYSEVRNIFMNNAVESLYKQRLGLPEQYDMATSVLKLHICAPRKYM